MAIATFHRRFHVIVLRSCSVNWIVECARFNALDRRGINSTMEGVDYVLRATCDVRDPTRSFVRLTRCCEHALEHGTNCIRHVTVPSGRGMELVRRVAEQIG